MSREAVFIYHDDLLKYKFNGSHPFNQQRLRLTSHLLQTAGALRQADFIPPAAAPEAELLRVHASSYVTAVKALSDTRPKPDWVSKAAQFGLDSQDTAYFENMHDITSLVAGGSIEAAEWVMSGKAKHALHLGGGLHHAMPNKGSGFCVYNDAAVAIATVGARYGIRVMYIDTDVHHGDGVQWSFYSDPNVCTFSIHETGKYLFPGTGGAAERGDGEGFGSSINVPVEPYTEDESWMACFSEAVERTARAFRPDLIVSQHGCDAHAFDPLAHVHCSMNIYHQMPMLIHRLAHELCDGRWVALGGGGYDIWRVVPRAWSLIWLTMIDHPLVSELERTPLTPLPEPWRKFWQPHSKLELPAHWLDDTAVWEAIPRRREIADKNRQSLSLALLYL